jgi:multidrug resistance efflux pump
MNEFSSAVPDVTFLPGVGGDSDSARMVRPSLAVRLLTQGRLLKIGLGASMLLAAAYALLSEQGYVASNNAVVSANLISLRVPIDGYVSKLNVQVGFPVNKGVEIGHVENQRLNDQYLSELQFSMLRNQLDAGAIEKEKGQLLQQRKILQKREALYLNGSTARLQQLTNEAEELATSKEALRDETGLQLERERELAKAGIVSRADLERMQRQYDVAKQEALAQRSAFEASRTQLQASARGIVLDNGSNGESYSQQRIDEIDIRLAETNRSLAQTMNVADAAHQTLSQLGPREALMRAAELIAPVSGAVWKVSASDGEHVSAGDTVAQFVNCDASFLVAAIPQDKVPSIEIGGQARLRLSGEKADRYGNVLAVVGERHPQEDNALAATPIPERNSTAMVYVSLANTGNNKSCLVGRTARVLLPVIHSGLFTKLSPGQK